MMTTMTKKSQTKKKARRIPEVLTEEEQERLLRQPNPRYRTGSRNLSLLRLMLDLGLRSAEMLSLKIDDIDWMSGKITVRQGKNNKDRVLWLGENDLELLRSWRERKSSIPRKNDLLFVTLKGDPVLDRYLRYMVKRYARKAGISKDVHPHMLRHSFATDIYRETKNLRLTQKALGHASLSTTEIYTHIVDQELEEALKTFRKNGKKV